jgi:hypothetical protein
MSSLKILSSLWQDHIIDECITFVKLIKNWRLAFPSKDISSKNNEQRLLFINDSILLRQKLKKFEIEQKEKLQKEIKIEQDTINTLNLIYITILLKIEIAKETKLFLEKDIQDLKFRLKENDNNIIRLKQDLCNIHNLHCKLSHKIHAYNLNKKHHFYMYSLNMCKEGYIKNSEKIYVINSSESLPDYLRILSLAKYKSNLNKQIVDEYNNELNIKIIIETNLNNKNIRNELLISKIEIYNLKLNELYEILSLTKFIYNYNNMKNKYLTELNLFNSLQKTSNNIEFINTHKNKEEFDKCINNYDEFILQHKLSKQNEIKIKNILYEVSRVGALFEYENAQLRLMNI